MPGLAFGGRDAVHQRVAIERTLRVRERIESQHLTAMSALQVVLQDYAATLARHEHEYFRERMTDEHRLVYKIAESAVRIAACRYHYGR